jgi:dTDP-4-dehydrorhamnose 3,5-epimerase
VKAVPLDLPGVYEITTQVHGDHRGSFAETFRDDWFREAVAPVSFVQDNQSLSRMAGTLRGLHFQRPPMTQGKLLRCAAGAIFEVAVDIRSGSPHFGKWAGVTLTAEAGNQIWVPEGFLNGFCTLRPDTLVCYKVTNYYSVEHEAGVAWDDPDIGIAWPEIVDASLLSGKDRGQPQLRDLPQHFTYKQEPE